MFGGGGAGATATAPAGRGSLIKRRSTSQSGALQRAAFLIEGGDGAAKDDRSDGNAGERRRGECGGGWKGSMVTIGLSTAERRPRRRQQQKRRARVPDFFFWRSFRGSL
ncbi:Hypothetical protein NTJ_03474 [Nesidiocoris tenuis]|uniref:Uncharacterized protein n=1 Tax=Nesidiocoris tenuis TaxID=355587 RepID=A0ABN7AEF7_9HEMI|nr:Hypothetical protein NTJ_03474 [Nesidiocoris tenuis]